jgi:Uma2 family endonuclease
LEPDLVVVLREHADRIGRQAIEGAPDLVVEILSPGTAKRDLVVKRKQYEEAAVPEYWIVDPESQSVEVLALEHARYARAGLYRRGDLLKSRILSDLEIQLSSVFTQK